MELLKGVVIVIDDELHNEQSDIKKIITKIEKKGFPVVAYDSLESAEKCMDNFSFVSFIILDWKMIAPIETEKGEVVTMGSVVSADENKRKLFEFINKLKRVCFTPIFIFTNKPEAEIENEIVPALKEEGLFFEDEKRNFIFVQNKSYMLKHSRLFSKVRKWIDNTPSIYVLKVWDNELLKAKNKIFWDLYDISKGVWPKVLWEHFEKENENPNIGLKNTIAQLIISSISLGELEKGKITRRIKINDMHEIRKIYKRIMYDDNNLDGIKPGDIYKDNNKYYLNIRPECDTVPGRSGYKNIYLLKGERIKDRHLKDLKKQTSNSGINPKINEAFVFLLEDDGIVKFDFKQLEIKTFSQEFQNKRICRLLPPFITNIQQRYTAFLGRFAVPRLPHNIEKELLKPQPPKTS